jgi:multicomponent Na+:H+ antiporter subunit E
MRLGPLALLVTLWILAWGQLTLANLLSGLLVATALLLAFPRRRREDGHVRLSGLGIVRLVAYVAAQLVTSNIVMIRQVLQRSTVRRPGVLAHRLRHPSAHVATAMSSIIALSPGTMTVDVAADSSVLYVHFFDIVDVGGARAALRRLERFVTDALARRPDPGHTTLDQEPS